MPFFIFEKRTKKRKSAKFCQTICFYFVLQKYWLSKQDFCKSDTFQKKFHEYGKYFTKNLLKQNFLSELKMANFPNNEYYIFSCYMIYNFKMYESIIISL